MRQREFDPNFVPGFCRESGRNVAEDLLRSFVFWERPRQDYDAVERSEANVLEAREFGHGYSATLLPVTDVRLRHEAVEHHTSNDGVSLVTRDKDASVICHRRR